MPAFESRRVRTQPASTTATSAGARPERISLQEKRFIALAEA
jgi:hypothetical protein